jgi:hypothetical protein
MSLRSFQRIQAVVASMVANGILSHKSSTEGLLAAVFIRQTFIS